MKNLLRSEELAQFLICLAALMAGDVPWWIYVLLVIGPDIGMIGYLISSKTGATLYNFTHHKGLGVVLYACGLITDYSDQAASIGPMLLQLMGLVIYGHSSMDRMFGYGLKYPDAFKHTHLGWIGGDPSGK